jgi:hypothetical protein
MIETKPSNKLHCAGFAYPRELINDNQDFYRSLLADSGMKASIAPQMSMEQIEQHLQVLQFCRDKGEIQADGRIINNRQVKLNVQVLEFTNAVASGKTLQFKGNGRTLEVHNLHQLVKSSCEARNAVLGKVIEENATHSLGDGRIITGIVTLTHGVDDNKLSLNLESEYLSANYNFATFLKDGSFNYSVTLKPGVATREKAIGFIIEQLVTFYDEDISKTTTTLVPQFVKKPKSIHFAPAGFKETVQEKFLLKPKKY